MMPNMEKEKVSEHFMRLGMTKAMKARIDAWRADQLKGSGDIPSFSDAVRQLIEKGLSDE